MGGKVAAFVKRLRKERGLTQAQLAQLAGVSRDTILQIEKGTGEHGFSTVESVVLALGATVNDARAGEQGAVKAQPRSPETERLLQMFEVLGTEDRALLLSTAIRLYDLAAARTQAHLSTPGQPKRAPRKT
jgi:transcriptional regulator with XRE-family HTH domain